MAASTQSPTQATSALSGQEQRHLDKSILGLLLPSVASTWAERDEGLDMGSALSSAIDESPAQPPTPPLCEGTPRCSSEYSGLLLPPPRQPGKKTLVLDLDGTLIDCLPLGATKAEPDFVYRDCIGARAKVWTRPFLAEFLQAASQLFEVVLFTAAAQRHADAVLANIDPTGVLIEHRLYGHHTVQAPEWPHVKDLSLLGRDLDQILIVDDCPLAALYHQANWVSVKAFVQAEADSRSDSALRDVLSFLQTRVAPCSDVRQAICAYYDQAACRPASCLSIAARRLKQGLMQQQQLQQQQQQESHRRGSHADDLCCPGDQAAPCGKEAAGSAAAEAAAAGVEDSEEASQPLRRVQRVHLQLSGDEGGGW